MRLFIALELPATDRGRIHRAVQPLRAIDLPVRWVDPGAYHLTLKFLGEVPAERLSELERAMGDAIAGFVPTSVAPIGLGGAPSLARPRVLWIEVEQSRALMQLQSRLDATLARIGFPSEARPFRPHITLGRIRGRRLISPADLEALRDLVAELDLGSRVATEAPTGRPTPTAPRAPGRHPTPILNPPIPTLSLALFESRLSSDGARYRVLARAPLASPEGSVRE